MLFLTKKLKIDLQFIVDVIVASHEMFMNTPRITRNYIRLLDEDILIVWEYLKDNKDYITHRRCVLKLK